MTISTISFASSTRSSIQRLQAELKDANQQVSSSRLSDVGLTLGRLTGSAVTARARSTSIDRLTESNKLISNRFQLIDNAMSTMTETAQGMIDQLVGAQNDATTTQVVVAGARSGLEQLAGVLNTNVGGTYLFAGDQLDQQPIAPYETTPPSPAQSATAASFAAFMTATGAATKADISAADMTAYLTTGYTGGTPPATYRFSDLFTDASWSANWSSASDTPVSSRIGRSETVNSSVSANEGAFRDITAAYAMLSDLGLGELNESARRAVIQTAQGQMKGGLDKVTSLRADIGTRMNRVTAANAALTAQKDIVDAAVASLEEVDLYEASQRVTRLETQLEASYTLTGRLQKLNLLDYLR